MPWDEPSMEPDVPTCDCCESGPATGRWLIVRTPASMPWVRKQIARDLCDDCEQEVRSRSETVSIEPADDSEARALNAKCEQQLSEAREA